MQPFSLGYSDCFMHTVYSYGLHLPQKLLHNKEAYYTRDITMPL